MNTNKTYTIKGMVCHRCITTLRNELGRFELTIESVSLGKLDLSFPEGSFNDHMLSMALSTVGFSIGLSKTGKIVEHVKKLIEHYFENLDPYQEKMRLSELISDRLNMSYHNVSSIFTSQEGITIENYLINYRMNRVKQLLVGSAYSLTEIAYMTGFSSVHHLSKQFKVLCGIAPSEYRLQTTFVMESFNNYTSNSGDDIPDTRA